MIGCILRPKCSNGNESKLYQDLDKFTGKNKALTNKYYKIATHPQFTEGVDDSLIRRDSNGELTLDSFLAIADLNDVDVQLLEFLNGQYPDPMPFEDAVNIVKEFNRDKLYKGSFVATMQFDGSSDSVRIIFAKATPANKAEAQRNIERMLAISDVISQLKEHGVNSSFIDGIISGNPELLNDTISGYRILLALSQGVKASEFTGADFTLAATFAYEALKDTTIMRRFADSVSETNFNETDAIKILAKTLSNFKWGKMNTFMSKVREFIYNIFKVFNFNSAKYNAEAEQIIRGLYSAVSALPRYKSYDAYTIGYESAQRSLGKVLTAVRRAASNIHNSSTKLYEGFFSQFNKKNLLSDIQLNRLSDEVCYTEICDITAALCEEFLDTLDQATKMSDELENIPYKANLIDSCREMYISLVTIMQELESVSKGLSESSDPEFSHYRSQISSAMSDLKSVIREDSSFVSKLQTEERKITLSFFEEVLGKDCIAVSAHRYLELHKGFIPKLKYKHSIKLTAEDIVDKYVSYESASMWVKSLSNSKDIAISQLEKFMRSIKFREEKVKDDYFVRLSALTKRAEKLKLSTKNMTWAMETDAKGKITGNFIVEEWWGEFNRQKSELVSKIREEFNEKVANGEIVISDPSQKHEIWQEFYNTHPDYISFMDRAFLDKDKPINKRRVLNLTYYTNPQFWDLSDNARDLLNDFINLKSEVDNYCLKDADGTEHGRRIWLPQFKKRSKVSITNSSYVSGNDVAAFAEFAELDEYGSPEFKSIDAEDLDIFDFENSAVDKVLLYGINKTDKTLEDLETNIPLSMAKYILMAIRYKTAKETSSYLSIAETVLNRREEVLAEDERVDNKGKYANEYQSMRALKDLRAKYSGENTTSKWFNALGRLNLVSSYILLSFNNVSSHRNIVAGTLQTVRNIIAKKTSFGMSDYIKSVGYQILDFLPLLTNTVVGTSKHFSRTLALLEYAGSLKLGDFRLRNFNTPAFTLSRIISFIANACMAAMSVGDHSIMANIYRTALMSHKGFDIETGKRKSIWDQLKFKDGRYLYQGLLVKKYKDIQLAVTLNKLKKDLMYIIEENAIVEDDDLKMEYSSIPSIARQLQSLRDLGYPIEILEGGIILTDQEVLDKVNDMLTPLIVTEEDIFKVLYCSDKFLIHDQGNYNGQDKVKVMTEEFVNGTTHFQGWLYGTIQATALNNVNVGTPSTVLVKKSKAHLMEDYKKHLEIFNKTEEDLSFRRFVKDYAERYQEYPMDQYNADVSYSTGLFSTWLGGIISFFVVKDAIEKVYNQNVSGVKGTNGEFKITPEEVMIESNSELTEDEKQEYISKIKEFSSHRYRAYLLLNILNPFMRKAGPTRKFLMRCGWSPDELSSMAFLGIAIYIGMLLKHLALLFYKGNLKKYGKSKPKGTEEAKRATNSSIKLINEGYLFNLMTDTINGPGSEKSESEIEKFENNPIARYGQKKEQIHFEDGTPTGDYIELSPDSDLYKEIIEGLTYKFTEYDKQDLGYVIAGYMYHHLNSVNRELVVKYNPVKTIKEFHSLMDMKSSTAKPIVDFIRILTYTADELTESDSQDVPTKSRLKKYYLDKYWYNKWGKETDKYGNTEASFIDYYGNEIQGYYEDEEGNIIYNYDHTGLQYKDFFSHDERVKNMQNLK